MIKSFEKIAIVGSSCLLPGCHTPKELSEIAAGNKVAISGVPEGYWRVSTKRMVASDKEVLTPDRTLTDNGGYVTGFEEIFRTDGFKVDAALIKELDPLFQWCLHTGREALASAKIFGNEQLLQNAGVIMGNLMYPTASMYKMAEEIYLEKLRFASSKNATAIHPYNRFMSGLPAILLAEALGMGGDSFAVDAACASSLYAIKLACDRLHRREADVMLAGAVSCSDPLFTHVGFSQIKAMSASGINKPFSIHADGLIPAQGAAFVVLKRLEDARKSKDTILGVIRGVGLSNDGRSGGFLSPSLKDQVRCMRQAYEMSGIAPEEVGYIECHATGTVIGDGVEIKSMSEVFPAGHKIALGSLKANLGHLITASGVAGLIKVLEMFRGNFIPSTPNAYPVLPEIESSFFYIPREVEAWSSEGKKRVAAVSNFGFGGNNAHLIVEAWQEEGTGVPPDVETRVDDAACTQPVSEKEAAAALAVVGISVRTNLAENKEELLSRILSKAGADEARKSKDSVSFASGEVSFPPRDLEKTIGQQLLLLKAATEAVSEIKMPDRDRTAVFVGMETDSEVTRGRLRWTLEEILEKWNCNYTANELERYKDIIAYKTDPASYLGSLANILANRINNQYDLKAYGFSIAGEALSGDFAVELACHGLKSGEIDAAVVGAVDMCRQIVHEEAVKKVFPEVGGSGADAAVVLVIKRLEDAVRDGDAVLCTIDSVAGTPRPETGNIHVGNYPGSYDVSSVLGYSHAAAGMLNLAAGVLMLSRGAFPGGVQEGGGMKDVKAGRISINVCNTTFFGKCRSTVLSGEAEGSREKSSGKGAGALNGIGTGSGASGRVFSYPLRLPDLDEIVRMREAASREVPVEKIVTEPVTGIETKPAKGLVMEKSVPEPAANARLLPPPPELQSLCGIYDRALAHGQSYEARLQAAVPQMSLPETEMSEAAAAIVTCLQTLTETHEQHLKLKEVSHKSFMSLLSGLRRKMAEQIPDGGNNEAAYEQPTGPAFTRSQLETLAAGKISSVFGEIFKPQDAYPVQVRMPEPPLLLCDRVTGLAGEPLSMGRGRIWTETDIRSDAWHLHDGRMPAGIFMEAGQADLLLASWLGVDMLNKGERAYRLLGCQLVFHGSLPEAGETLRFEITGDGFASHSGVRLFLFHYQCRVGEEVRISMTNGQAGFFTREELDNSQGLVWSAQTARYTPESEARIDPPAAGCDAKSFPKKNIEQYLKGNLRACFGSEFGGGSRGGRLPVYLTGKFLLFDEIVSFDTCGGPKGRGYLSASMKIDPGLWFFNGHFKNDPCMPGTLMAEAFLQIMAFYIAACGYTRGKEGWHFEPVPDEKYTFSCRGQVSPDSKLILYEIFVDEIISGPMPAIFAHVLGTVDGLKAMGCERLGLRLVPGREEDKKERSLATRPAPTAASTPTASTGENITSDNLFRGTTLGAPFPRKESEVIFSVLLSENGNKEEPQRQSGEDRTPAEEEVKAQALEWIEPWSISLKDEPWIADHCPTYTIPTLPLTYELDSMIDAVLSKFPDKKAILVDKLETKKWMAFHGSCLHGRTIVRKCCDDMFKVSLEILEEKDNHRKYINTAACFITIGDEYPAPEGDVSFTVSNTVDMESPYKDGIVFHGPSLQLMREWKLGKDGACCLVDAESRGVPYGRVNPGALDAALHAIPHDNMQVWDPKIRDNMISYPVKIEQFRLFRDVPARGGLEVSLKLESIFSQRLSHVRFVISREGSPVCSFRLSEVILPKGSLISAPPLERRDFLLHRRFIPGLTISRFDGEGSGLDYSDVAESNFLKGSVEHVFRVEGTVEEMTEKIAVKEYAAAKLLLHPSDIVFDGSGRKCANTPLNEFLLQPVKKEKGVRILPSEPLPIDLEGFKEHWTGQYGASSPIMLDIALSLVQKYLRRLILKNPSALASFKGKPVMYLANHQTMLESFLFLLLVSGLQEMPLKVVSKKEHSGTLMSKLISFGTEKMEGLQSPFEVLYINRESQMEMLRSFHGIADEMARSPFSLFVHAEGHRAFAAGQKTEKLSSVLVDMALQFDLPVVPVRFYGGLPVEPADTRLDFPVGDGMQDIYIGEPVSAAEIRELPYAGRIKKILSDMNTLGAPYEYETPLGSDPGFSGDVLKCMGELGIPALPAAILQALRMNPRLSGETKEFMDALLKRSLRLDRKDEGARIARLLLLPQE